MCAEAVRRPPRPRRRPRAAAACCARAAAATCCSPATAPAATATGPCPTATCRSPTSACRRASGTRLQIPVSVAFFFVNSTLDRVAAFYPSPAGATESLLSLDTWDEVVAANPELATLAPDVEAFLRAHRRARRAATRPSASSCPSTPATSWSASCGACGAASTAAPRPTRRWTRSSPRVRARRRARIRADGSVSCAVVRRRRRPRRAVRRGADAACCACGSPKPTASRSTPSRCACQIMIEPQRRRYDAAEEDRLFELFGETPRWGDTLRPFLWTQRRH